MNEYLLYLGTIPWWFYLVLLTLIIAFLHVGRVQITYANTFFCSSYFCKTVILSNYTVKFQVRLLEK